MEKLLEEISFSIPDTQEPEIVIDKNYVKERFMDRIQADNIDRFIL